MSIACDAIAPRYARHRGARDIVVDALQRPARNRRQARRMAARYCPPEDIRLRACFAGAPGFPDQARIRLKSLIWIGLIAGSTAGGMTPELWGGSVFSGWGVALSTLGGLVGIWAGYKLGRMM